MQVDHFSPQHTVCDCISHCARLESRLARQVHTAPRLMNASIRIKISCNRRIPTPREVFQIRASYLLSPVRVAILRASGERHRARTRHFLRAVEVGREPSREARRPTIHIQFNRKCGLLDTLRAHAYEKHQISVAFIGVHNKGKRTDISPLPQPHYSAGFETKYTKRVTTTAYNVRVLVSNYNTGQVYRVDDTVNEYLKWGYEEDQTTMRPTYIHRQGNDPISITHIAINALPSPSPPKKTPPSSTRKRNSFPT